MNLSLLLLAIALVWTDPTPAAQKSEREHDYLIGPVSAITIETAKLSENSGRVKEGRLRKERVITYDRSGNMVREGVFMRSPSTSQISYRYDADGNRTDSLIIEGESPDLFSGPGVYHQDERITRTVWRIFKRDSNGNRLQEEVVSHGINPPQPNQRVVATYQHTYDDQGNRKSTSYLFNSQLLYRLDFTYDDSPNATSMRKYSRDGSLIHEEKYTYELDSTGNWIKRISTRSLKNKSKFEAREVTYRKITYF